MGPAIVKANVEALSRMVMHIDIDNGASALLPKGNGEPGGRVVIQNGLGISR